jgi:hypothetical protein
VSRSLASAASAVHATPAQHSLAVGSRSCARYDPPRRLLAGAVRPGSTGYRSLSGISENHNGKASLAHARISTVTGRSELFKYPIAYIIEVGWWTVTDREAAGLRAYLQKGGFLFVDDFKPAGWRGPGGGWEPFAETMRRVLPEVQFLDMLPSDPVFHTFFEIEDLAQFPQAYVSGNPVFKGVFEDNDRSKRLIAIINYNTDVSQFWEWSGRGLRPFDETNEAYKLGVNYLIYGLTH